jgi:2-polyprenyl-6-methoxyphenol hydroxylase-like FAD-dependent oxidoreductase
LTTGLLFSVVNTPLIVYDETKYYSGKLAKLEDTYMDAVTTRKAIVIGAGIGGLCTALSLQQQGWRVSIYDKASSLREAGAGIVLAANAMKALDLLGVGGTVRNVGAPVVQADIRKWDGTIITSLPAAKQAELYGTQSYVIHRADLQAILVQAVTATTPIQTNKQWIDGIQSERGVTAVFKDGTQEKRLMSLSALTGFTLPYENDYLVKVLSGIRDIWL